MRKHSCAKDGVTIFSLAASRIPLLLNGRERGTQYIAEGRIAEKA
jgi:hypothetical protein